jgi:hypothetical protein
MRLGLMRRLLGLTAGVAFVLTLAGAAQAATTPIIIGSGWKPSVAVDASGTGYFAWNHQITGNEDAVDFCVLPRGASACSPPVELRPGGSNPLAPPYVFLPTAGTVWILAHTCCSPDQTLLYVSSDGGKTFAAPTKVGQQGPSGDAILGPGSAISLVSDTVTGSTNFQRDASDGSTTGIGTSIGSDEYGGTIGLFGGQPVVAYWDFNAGVPNHVDFTAFKGGDYNTASSWTPPAVVGPGSYTRIASGPSGLFLMYQDGAVGHERYYVRKYTGTGFGAPVDISGAETGYVNGFSEDPSGRLHAVWRRNPGDLRYTTSLDGVHWSPVITVLADSGIFDQPGLRLAAAADGKGWTVWDTNSYTGPVKVAGLDYAGGAPGETSITVGSDVITLKTPTSCVAPGTITAVLEVRSKKPKGHVVVKVKKVDFYVDTKKAKTVTHAPFKAVLKITALQSKSKHFVRARAFLKSHHGPQRTRTITAPFVIC